MARVQRGPRSGLPATPKVLRRPAGARGPWWVSAPLGNKAAKPMRRVRPWIVLGPARGCSAWPGRGTKKADWRRGPRAQRGPFVTLLERGRPDLPGLKLTGPSRPSPSLSAQGGPTSWSVTLVPASSLHNTEPTCSELERISASCLAAGSGWSGREALEGEAEVHDSAHHEADPVAGDWVRVAMALCFCQCVSALKALLRMARRTDY
ncbi:hypothetical protein NDU88_011502 [Pleurodeles waltl]|uniref:Uncharacterized protein n=1 Tax=Pleurodeles waltl TaxID=8319 RepID=A0AAV7R1J0_PLEWA|nr:hypothetical protein NDU88_011502 [Pleurodeles waltl]